MTFLERLAIDHPRYAEWETYDGTKVGKGCPCDYGYEPEQFCEHIHGMPCTECWNREMEVSA